jgi:hypothetical protein
MCPRRRSFVFGVLTGCSSDLASASSFRLRKDVTSQVGQYRIDATSLVFNYAAGDREVRLCGGLIRGVQLVPDQGRDVLVLACGQPLQVSLAFVVDGVQVDEGDACDFLLGKLPAASDKPWRLPPTFQAFFSPFDQAGSCS